MKEKENNKKEVTPEEMEKKMVTLRSVIDFCLSKLSWIITIIVLICIFSAVTKTDEYAEIKKASETPEAREEYLLEKQKNITGNGK